MPTQPNQPDRPRVADLPVRALTDGPTGKQQAAQVLGGFFRSVGGLSIETE